MIHSRDRYINRPTRTRRWNQNNNAPRTRSRVRIRPKPKHRVISTSTFQTFRFLVNMSTWCRRLEILGLPTNPPSSTVTIDVYLPLPPAISSLNRLSRLISTEVDRALGFTAETMIVDLIRAWWPYDRRSRTGERLYRLEDEGIGNWRWMLEQVRRGGGYLEVEGRLVRRYLMTGPVRSRSRSSSRSRSGFTAGHSQYGTCPICRGVCAQGAMGAGTTRRPLSGRSSFQCGPGCLACFGHGSIERDENSMEVVHGR